MIFNARVLSNGGGVVNLRIEASNKEAAIKSASKKGQVLSVKKQRTFDLSPGMNASDRSVFILRLSTMIGSKMGTTEALRLISTTFGGAIKNAAQLMLQRVENGMSLSDAMDNDRKNFPVAVSALVRAGSQTGETWRALKDAADFENKIRNVQKGAAKDILAAIFSFFSALALIIATTQYIGPKITDNPIFRDPKKVNIEWVKVMAHYTTITMIVLTVILSILLFLATIGRTLIPDIADRLILKIPYYKDLILSRNNYVVLYKLGLLVSSGVRIEESLSLTAEGSPRGAMKKDIERALDAVRGGRPWAMAMETLHPTDRASLSSSSDRKDIANVLSMLADQYKELYLQRIQSFAPILKTIAAFFIMLSGFLMFGLTMLPMLQMSANF